jgi:bacillithiol biosynthesis cysteine-adding enzyme BshC
VQESRSPASASACVGLDIRELPWVRRFAADYAYRFEALADFFAGNPAEPGAWSSVIEATTRHVRDRETLASLIEAQQRTRLAPAEAREACALLRHPRSVAIVTGQQAGVFGGPLYTLLKALTAIRVAANVGRDHGVPTVAVFWIDSEDHDWAEVASASVLDAEFTTRSFTLPPPEGAGHAPVAQLQLEDSVRETISALAAALPPTEFTAALIGQLGDAYLPGRGVSEAFGRWLETLLGPMGLVVFDCADPAAKPLVTRVFVEELRHPGRTSALAARAGGALEARGFHAQVDAHLDAAALFHLSPDGRQAIRMADGGFSVGGRYASSASLIAEATEHPEHFSPNVLLRPLVQDTLFPTAAYVSGPSELAYLGQLRGVYETFGIPMPLVVPRAHATVLDSAAARFLARYALPLDALQARDESTLNRLLEAQLPPEVEAAFHDTQRSVTERMSALVPAVGVIDPTLEGAAKSTLGKIEHELRTLHGKIIHAAKKRDETLRRQFTRASALAFPGGHLQERTLGFVYFLNRYGPALVEVLASGLPDDRGHHWVLTL